MLERAGLLIEPLRRGPQGSYRAVRCGATGEPLGHAFRLAAGGPLGPRGYSVFEAPDGSLLTTVRKRWWLAAPMVADSEGRPFAVVNLPRLDWIDGRSIARIMFHAGGGAARTATGVDLADWTREPGGLRLRFHPRIADEPLIKMALLGAALMVG